jgi:hypothetical protein
MKQADVVSEFEREVREWQKIDPHVRPEVDGRRFVVWRYSAGGDRFDAKPLFMCTTIQELYAWRSGWLYARKEKTE